MRCQPLGAVGLGVERGRRELGEERSGLLEVEQEGLLQHRRRPAAPAARGRLRSLALRPFGPRRLRSRQLPSLLIRSEEHTSELQSPCNLVCRLLLEKKKKKIKYLLVTTVLECYPIDG